MLRVTLAEILESQQPEMRARLVAMASADHCRLAGA